MSINWGSNSYFDSQLHWCLLVVSKMFDGLVTKLWMQSFKMADMLQQNIWTNVVLVHRLHFSFSNSFFDKKYFKINSSFSFSPGETTILVLVLVLPMY